MESANLLRQEIEPSMNSDLWKSKNFPWTQQVSSSICLISWHEIKPTLDVKTIPIYISFCYF
jgi:hypothetical protein